MNERIKELAKQAMIFSSKNGGWRISTHVPNDFTEKLAELIIQECADLIDNQRMITDTETYNEVFVAGYNAREESAKLILQHFGVQND